MQPLSFLMQEPKKQRLSQYRTCLNCIAKQDAHLTTGMITMKSKRHLKTEKLIAMQNSKENNNDINRLVGKNIFYMWYVVVGPIFMVRTFADLNNRNKRSNWSNQNNWSNLVYDQWKSQQKFSPTKSNKISINDFAIATLVLRNFSFSISLNLCGLPTSII